MGMKKDLLVTLADGNYIDQAKQLFSSVYWNAGWKGDYLLLAYNIPGRDLRWFRGKGILVRECESILPGINSRLGHAPLTTLSRFFLFTPEFKKWKNIVFLDGDIVVRGSLDELTKILGFAAVRIHNIHRTSLKGSFRKRTNNNKHLFRALESNCDLRRPAFNSGVMAFNTDIISDTDFQNLKNILLLFKDIIFISEETVLNLHFYDKWQELSAVYNFCPGYELFYSGGSPETLKGIVHHSYSNLRRGKPWDQENPLYSEWKSNLEKADLIEIANPQAPKRILNKREEAEYGLYLKNLSKRYFYKVYRAKMSFFIKKIARSARNLYKNTYIEILNTFKK